MIEPVIQRTAGKRFGPIEVRVLDGLLRRPRLADGVPVQAEVPLADAGRRVAVLPQHRRQGQLPRLEDGTIERVGDAVKIPPVMAGPVSNA